MDVCLILNPAARGHRAVHLRDQLTQLAARCSLRPTRGPDDARLLARQAVQDGFTTIIAAGGDGTINEVLNGIGDEPGGFEKVRLGVLPLGTVNVFAKDLGLPLGSEAAWKVIAQGRELKIDVPFAEFTRAGRPECRYFAQLAGAGLDSRAIGLVDWGRKKRWGAFAYVLAGFQALSEHKAQVVVASDNLEHRGELALVGNGRFYGGRFQFFPQSRWDDGLLDVLVFPKANWICSFRVMVGWMAGRLHLSAGAIAFQAARFTLTSSRETALQLDGENVGSLPARFGVLPKGLRVLVP